MTSRDSHVRANMKVHDNFETAVLNLQFAVAAVKRGLGEMNDWEEKTTTESIIHDNYVLWVENVERSIGSLGELVKLLKEDA